MNHSPTRKTDLKKRSHEGLEWRIYGVTTGVIGDGITEDDEGGHVLESVAEDCVHAELEKARAIKKQIMVHFLLSHADCRFVVVVISVLAAPLNSSIVSTRCPSNRIARQEMPYLRIRFPRCRQIMTQCIGNSKSGEAQNPSSYHPRTISRSRLIKAAVYANEAQESAP